MSRAQWLAARKDLLARERELTSLHESVNADRRRLPMVPIYKDYTFAGPGGPVTLPDLFEGRRELIVQHFMFSPAWDAGCPSCSASCDEISQRLLARLRDRDTSFVVISLAPIAKIMKYKTWRGWDFSWYSSYGSDFNYDYHASFTPEQIAKGKVEYNFDLVEFPSAEGPGISVFYKDKDGNIFHTYSAYARGSETTINTYNYLDFVPKGRDEDGLPFGMAWLRHHDRYDDGYLADADRPYWPAVSLQS